MRRFFIPHTEIHKASPKIHGQDAQHIKRVLRLQPGNRILLIDGSGYEYEAELTGLSDAHVSIAVLRKYRPKMESPLRLVVVQGFLKEKKMDLLVRHLTELGMTKWQPVYTEHALPRLDEKRLISRIDRWNTIVREAMKQCSRTLAPEMAMPLTFQEAVHSENDADLKIIFWENETTPLRKSAALDIKESATAIVLLGPEGGFSENEMALAKSAGFISASLGPRTLRAETAAVSACSLVQYLYGDMGKNILTA